MNTENTNYINYIQQNCKINLEWQVMKGVGNVEEDFSRSQVTLILVSDMNRWPLAVTADRLGVVRAEIPEGLPEGVYGFELIWIKNAGHLGSRCINRTRKACVFGIDAKGGLAQGCYGQPATIKIRSIASSYGYDGLDAYELSILRGKTNLNEDDWLERLCQGTVVIDTEAKELTFAENEEVQGIVVWTTGDTEDVKVAPNVPWLTASRVKPTIRRFVGYRGDINNDGVVDVNDQALLGSALADASQFTPDELLRADANGNGKVDVTDMPALLSLISSGELIPIYEEMEAPGPFPTPTSDKEVLWYIKAEASKEPSVREGSVTISAKRAEPLAVKVSQTGKYSPEQCHAFGVSAEVPTPTDSHPIFMTIQASGSIDLSGEGKIHWVAVPTERPIKSWYDKDEHYEMREDITRGNTFDYNGIKYTVYYDQKGVAENKNYTITY